MTSKTLNQCTRNELTQHYNRGIIWLETHSAQPDTNNALDINGRPYDAELYEKCLRFLEKIENELNKRFPDWRNSQSDVKNADSGKVERFNNGELTLGQLNKDEQLQVMRDNVHKKDVFWWEKEGSEIDKKINGD